MWEKTIPVLIALVVMVMVIMFISWLFSGFWGMVLLFIIVMSMAGGNAPDKRVDVHHYHHKR